MFTGAFVDIDGNRGPVGQVRQSSQLPNAQIQFVLANDAPVGDLTVLLEGLCKEAGAWGAKQVIAELAPESEIYPPSVRLVSGSLASSDFTGFRMALRERAPQEAIGGSGTAAISRPCGCFIKLWSRP